MQPFVAASFATGIGQSLAGIGPMAIVERPDATILASGGPSRNELFVLPATGGPAGTPLATLPFPVYALAFDPSGSLWASTGGGPLLKLDPNAGAVLGQYGDGLTQALAINPTTGLIYVSTGSGIDTFDPATMTFTAFSKVRVGSLAFAPDGTLWGVEWPSDQGTVVTFDASGDAQAQLQLAAPVNALAFGAAGSPLQGLLLLAHDEPGPNETGTDLTLVDLTTLHTVTIASGGTAATC